jgi:hypothetical protein
MKKLLITFEDGLSKPIKNAAYKLSLITFCPINVLFCNKAFFMFKFEYSLSLLGAERSNG